MNDTFKTVKYLFLETGTLYSYVSFNARDSQVLAYTPFYFYFTVPLKKNLKTCRKARTHLTRSRSNNVQERIWLQIIKKFVCSTILQKKISLKWALINLKGSDWFGMLVELRVQYYRQHFYDLLDTYKMFLVLQLLHNIENSLSKKTQGGLFWRLDLKIRLFFSYLTSWTKTGIISFKN